MKYWLVILFILSGLIIRGQNLVPNPSFENYNQLPCNLNKDFIQDFLVDWLQPIPSSTDYWHSNIDIGCDLNPISIERNPRTGSGMVGLITTYIYQNLTDEYKEYVEVKLSQTLTVGKLYCGEFYTFNANYILNFGVGPGSDILASNNISMAFSDTLVFYPVTSDSRDNLVTPGSVKIREREIIPADNNWHRIEGCFVADKNYEYLLIGNFDSVDSTLFVRDGNTRDLATAYYFVDDVSLVELPFAAPALLTNVVLCHDQDSIVLDAFADGATGYVWPDGSTESEYIVRTKASDSYTVSIQYNQFTYQHTFNVHYTPDVDLGPDTLLCREESITLAPQLTNQDFFWYDLSTDLTKVIYAEGTYWIEIASTCTVRDTIVISYTDCPGFVPNVFTPNGDQFNPVFEIENIESRDWNLQVFNRWGEKVYEKDFYDNTWDGNGLPSGVYYYYLYSSSLEKRVKGWVQIIRN